METKSSFFKDSPGRDIRGQILCGMDVGNLLGEGSFGSVYEVKLQDGQKRALKIISSSKNNEEYGIEDIGEIDILQRLSHPYKVSSERLVLPSDFESLKSEKFVKCDIQGWGLVLPLGKGSLPDFRKDFNNDEIIELVLQCVSGLQFLHSRGIVHMDVKPLNMLVVEETSRKYSCLISDFGSALLLEINQTKVQNISTGITIPYAAPEIMKGFPRGFAGTFSDMWSVGASLFELFSGELVVPSKIQSQIKTDDYVRYLDYYLQKDILEERIETEIKSSRKVKNLLKNLLQKDHDARYTAEEVLHLFGRKVICGTEIFSPQYTDEIFLVPQDMTVLYLEIIENYFEDYPMGIIYTTIDNFYRMSGLLFGKFINDENLLLIFLTSLFIAIKIHVPSVEILPKQILYFEEHDELLSEDFITFVNDMVTFSPQELLDMEKTMLDGLNGIVNHDSLYKQCSTRSSLIASYELMVNPHEYLMETDFSNWGDELNKNSRLLVNPTVKDFFEILDSYYGTV